MNKTELGDVIGFLVELNQNLNYIHIENTIQDLKQLEKNQNDKWKSHVDYVTSLTNDFQQLAREHGCELQISTFENKNYKDLTVCIKKNDYKCGLLEFSNKDRNIEDLCRDNV